MSLFSEHYNVGACGTAFDVLSSAYCTPVMLSYSTGVETFSLLARCVGVFRVIV